MFRTGYRSHVNGHRAVIGNHVGLDPRNGAMPGKSSEDRVRSIRISSFSNS
jgi:hypothetical protein